MDGLILFVCRVPDTASSLILGCISIVHGHQDYSELHVNNIPKDEPIKSLMVEMGHNYSFAIFEWTSSGLLLANMITSGVLYVEETSTVYTERTTGINSICTF